MEWTAKDSESGGFRKLTSKSTATEDDWLLRHLLDHANDLVGSQTASFACEALVLDQMSA